MKAGPSPMLWGRRLSQSGRYVSLLKWSTHSPGISGRKQRGLANYDDFALRKGAKLDKPGWVAISRQNVEKLMKGVLAQMAWPGGTDWRSPFNYVMESNPPPDSIFFMTDGQLADTKTALQDIDKALRKSLPAPKVFSLWIKNKSHDPEPMKRLAKKYAGEFREVGEKGK